VDKLDDRNVRILMSDKLRRLRKEVIAAYLRYSPKSVREEAEICLENIW
jgi:hypothetical protein